MKIYDCFMFSDENELLDLRLNSLNKYVDKFIIVEAAYLHNGQSKKLNFNINMFKEFKEKIEYIVVKSNPPNLNLEKINETIQEQEKRKIINSILRDHYQRDQITAAVQNLEQNDIILISDLDEIPNLNNINFEKMDNQLLIFKQKMFYYKLNLNYENFIWYGTKAIKKKYFKSAQWLRNIKNKKYPIWRIDTFFSKKKYNNIKFIEDGGWHFTCIKSASEIFKKLMTFAHHQDFESSNITLDYLRKKIENKYVLYDHNKDKKNNDKWFSETKLKKIEIDNLPNYIKNNQDKFKKWLD